MPELRDITVHVTDDRGNALQEWGVQRLRSQDKVSAYIQSTTDMPFRVSIQPKIPYVGTDVHSSNAFSSRHAWSNISDDCLDRRGESQPTCKSRRSSYSSLPRPRKYYDSPYPPAYDFLASLYVDGRQMPERRTIIYLDPSHPDFTPPDGRVRFKSRWVQGHDGSMKEHAWVFKDVGIEASFGKLLISQNGLTVDDFDEPQEDALVRGLNSADLGAETGPRREQIGKVGQIVVTLQRVKLGRKTVEPDYQAKHREGEKDESDMDGIEREITHTTGLAHVKTLPRQSIWVVDHCPYKRGEGTYATFQFFYRSQESLEKFNFIDFPRKKKSKPRRLGVLDTGSTDTTPLSIARGNQGDTKPTEHKSKAYEENVRDQTFKDSEPEFTCNDGYRDTKAVALREKSPQLGSQAQGLVSLPLAPPKVGHRISAPHGNKNTRFSGQEEIIGGHSNTSSPYEDEKGGGRSVTPSSTSSTEFAYYPPVLMKTHMNTNISPPKGPHNPVNNIIKPMQENIPTGPRIAKEDQPLLSSSTVSTKLRPPTPHPTASLFPQDRETAETLVALSTQPGNKLYRKPTPSSDADDERDDSDPETEPDDDKENKDIADPGDFWSADKDDEGLHEQLEAVKISPRKRPFEDEDDEKAWAKIEAPNGLDGETQGLIASEDGAELWNRQRRNALTEGDKKAIEEFNKAKRVKTGSEEEALLVS